MGDELVTAGRFDRRRFLYGAAAVGASAALLGACSEADSATGVPGTVGPAGTIPTQAAGSTLGQGAGDLVLFSAEDLNFQGLYALGGSGVNAMAGEVFSAADAANAAGGGTATYQTFYDAFVTMGDTLRADADAALAAGHRVTARNRYLRSANYYNQALFFVLGTSTPAAEPDVYVAMNDAWAQAAALFEPVWEYVEIPYEDSSLPGWLIRPLGAAGARPTVILNNGSDGQNVDLWAFGAQAAIERGWNALIFEGPGQGQMLFLREIPFRPDWEAVITPVVDYLDTRPEVDSRRIALIGWSEGGELVPRAASFEHRLAAVIADPGCVDVYEAFPQVLRSVADSGTEAQVNQEWADVIVPGSTPSEFFTLQKRLEIYSREALLQARAGEVPSDWYGLSRTIEQFQNRDVVGQITCPVAIGNYQGEQFYVGQATELQELLRTESQMIDFTDVHGAQYHCGPLAPQWRNERYFDWLDEVVG